MAARYTAEQCDEIREQLHQHPQRLSCPVHQTTMTIRQTLSWRRMGDLTEDHVQKGWPSEIWTVRRALVWCWKCGFDESVLLDKPARAPRATPKPRPAP